AHGCVELVLDNVLQVEIDGQMNLIAVTRRTFLSTIKDDFLTGPVMLDIAITVLAPQIFVERTFHALNAAMLEVGETDDVTKHDAVRINAGRVVLEINAAQTFAAEFLAE